MTQTSPLQIRSALFPDDELSMSEIVAAVWSGGGAAVLEAQYGQIGNGSWQEYQSADVFSWMKAPGASAYVVVDQEAGGEVVGFCSLQIDRERDVATVGYNAVRPSHQGSRIGSLMMDYIMGQIRESGVGYAGVIVADNDEHAPARRVYEKAGFQTVYSLRYMFQKLS